MTHPGTHSRLAFTNAAVHILPHPAKVVQAWWPLGPGVSNLNIKPPNTVSYCGSLLVENMARTITTGLLSRNAADSEGSKGGVGDRDMARHVGWQVSPYPVTDRQGLHDEKGPHNIGRTETFPSVPTNSRTLPPRCTRGV